VRVEGIEEDTYRGGLGQQAQFIKFQLERGSEVRGAKPFFFGYCLTVFKLRFQSDYGMVNL